MLKLCRVTKVKVLFLALAYVFNSNLFEFSAAILEKGLLSTTLPAMFQLAMTIQILHIGNYDCLQELELLTPTVIDFLPPPSLRLSPTPPEIDAIWKA